MSDDWATVKERGEAAMLQLPASTWAVADIRRTAYLAWRDAVLRVDTLERQVEDLKKKLGEMVQEGMTVKGLIDLLSKYDGNLPVGLAFGDADLIVVADYLSDEEDRVWLDLEAK